MVGRSSSRITNDPELLTSLDGAFDQTGVAEYIREATIEVSIKLQFMYFRGKEFVGIRPFSKENIFYFFISVPGHDFPATLPLDSSLIPKILFIGTES